MIKLPTENELLELFNIYKVPNSIKEHCLKVREIAVFLANKLKESGVDINIELVDRVALVHDLFKAAAIKDPTPNKFHTRALTEEELAMRLELRAKYPGMHETEIAYEIFRFDYPEFAKEVLSEGAFEVRERSLEVSVVHYSDYITQQNIVVTLEERYDYFKQKYENTDEHWDKSLLASKEEERKIFQHLTITPEDLKHTINEGAHNG